MIYKLENLGINIYFTYFSITNFSYAVRWPAGGSWDPRRVLGLHRLVGSHVVLIQWAALGRFMRRGRQWAYEGVGHIEQLVWA